MLKMIWKYLKVVPGAMDVLVDGVNLAAGKTVTFVYSAMRWCSRRRVMLHLPLPLMAARVPVKMLRVSQLIQKVR